MRATLVDLSSLKKERSFFISNFASELSNSKPTTQKTTLKEILPAIDWMDMNGHEDFLLDKQKMHDAYLGYTNHINQRLKSSDEKLQIKARVAKDKQWICRKIIEIGFPGQLASIEAGIGRIKAVATPKKVVEASYVEKLWKLNLELFTKLSKQIISNAASTAYIDVCDIEIHYNPSQIKRIGMRAQYAFIQCFRILTRINNAELIKLAYSDDYTKERDVLSQEFYEVKFRANYRPVTFRIQSKGYTLFKQYLALREVLLEGRYCPYLFFSLGENNTKTPRQISTKHTDEHQQHLRRMKYLPEISKALQDRQLRNLNTTFLRKSGFSAKGVADNNNHSLRVADQVYAANSLEDQISELDNLFAAIESANKNNKKLSKSKTRSMVSGSCSEQSGEPKSIVKSPPFQPDCETPQGCLFCVYYVCHADEEDIKKLLSLKFVIALIREKAIDFDLSDEIYALLELRIDYILDQISKKTEASKKLVLKMMKTVLNDGVLTAFWDNRLDYYEDMGLIVL